MASFCQHIRLHPVNIYGPIYKNKLPTYMASSFQPYTAPPYQHIWLHPANIYGPIYKIKLPTYMVPSCQHIRHHPVNIYGPFTKLSCQHIWLHHANIYGSTLPTYIRGGAPLRKIEKNMIFLA